MDRLISRACQDVGDIHNRLFDHRPFLNGELQSFIREFEVKKGIRDVESLLKAGETLTELGSSLDSLQGQHSSILSSFGKSVEEATAAVEALCHQQPPEVDQGLLERRERRQRVWQAFLEKNTAQLLAVDNLTRHKELEYRQHYAQLEQKLNIS